MLNVCVVLKAVFNCLDMFWAQFHNIKIIQISDKLIRNVKSRI